jgi:cell division transport system permease protein
MSMRRFGRARPGLPLGRDAAARFLPWVLGLMVYAAVLSGIGLIALHASLRGAQRALAATLTLEVPADASPARLRTAVAVLRQTPGVASAHLLDVAATARLLIPWFGSTAALAHLPVPRLIDLQATPDRRLDLAALHKRLLWVVPGARLEDHRPLLQGMRAAALRVDGILAAIIGVALALIAASAAFAAGARLPADRPEIELLLLLGATDRAIARQAMLRWLRLGALGGLIGAVAALLTVRVLGDVGAVVRLPAAVAATPLGDWRLWAVAIGSVPAAGLIAMAGARVAVLRRLAQLP